MSDFSAREAMAEKENANEARRLRETLVARGFVGWRVYLGGVVGVILSGLSGGC